MLEKFNVKTISEQEAKKIQEELKLQVEAEISKPFTVSIMGQTGVGKSSLINALFGTKLKTDPLRPCTKEIECVVAENDGHQLWFYDLPGIGESEETEANYIEQYRQTLINSDIVLWAILADSRSVSLDFNALRKMLGTKPKEQNPLINRIIFVLTKADLLIPDPWILGISEKGKYAVFSPQSETENLLKEKCSYYINLVVNLYNSLTHLNSKDKDSIKVISCSARFKYNLAKLMLEIVQQMPEEATLRFQNFYENKPINQMEPSAAKKLRNYIQVDLDKSKH